MYVCIYIYKNIHGESHCRQSENKMSWGIYIYIYIWAEVYNNNNNNNMVYSGYIGYMVA